MATATSFAQLRVPPTKSVVSNALFSHPILTLGLTPTPNSAKSLKSLKFSKNFSNVSPSMSFGFSKRSTKSRSSVVRCEASSGRVKFSVLHFMPISELIEFGA